jgi:FtsZ-binding cell division protein ZapB
MNDIETLRAEEKEMSDQAWDLMVSRLETLQAEVEKLRARYDARVEEWQEDCRLRDEAEAENERLREERDNWLVVTQNSTREIEKMQALHRETLDKSIAKDMVIDRLREDGIMGRDTAYRRRDAAEAEVVTWQEAAKVDNARWHKAEAEVERLRERLEFIAEHPSIAADTALKALQEGSEG